MTEVYDWMKNEDGYTFSLWVRRADDCRWEDYGSCFRVQHGFDLGILEWLGHGDLPDWFGLSGVDA